MAITVYLFRRRDQRGKPTGNYYMQYDCPITRKRIRRTTGTDKERTALGEANKWEAEVNAGGGHKRQQPLTWEEFVDRYDATVVRSWARHSQRKVHTIFREFQRITRVQAIGHVTSAVVDDYMAELIDQGNSAATRTGKRDYLAAAFRWAVKRKYLAEMPEFEKIIRTGGGESKGRAVTLEELERMQAVVPEVLTYKVGKGGIVNPKSDDVDAWCFLLGGLFNSGLRLSESVGLHWSDRRRICVVDIDSEYPMFRIPAQQEKGHKSRLLPIAPEFVEQLRSVPPEERRGFVFSLRSRTTGARLEAEVVGKIVSQIGRRAGVKVTEEKCASAHDLRRSYGTRWARRLMPADLKTMMRHSDIQTTMKYYVDVEADNLAKTVWAASGANSWCKTDG